VETAKLTGFIITAGHLDIEWYQPLRSYRFWTIETFEDLKKAVKRDDFTCYVLDGQVFPLEEYLEAVPQDEKEMRSLIGQGKLAIGPFYTQFDEWLPSAENMIRNCRSGCMRRFCGCDKGTRSVPATAKMWVECGVGMSVANDLAARNPEPL
jgi:alpha-mannosidase